MGAFALTALSDSQRLAARLPLTDASHSTRVQSTAASHVHYEQSYATMGFMRFGWAHTAPPARTLASAHLARVRRAPAAAAAPLCRSLAQLLPLTFADRRVPHRAYSRS